MKKWSFSMLFLAAALWGCGQGGGQAKKATPAPATQHAEQSEHPTSEHPTGGEMGESEHPQSEHPTSEHPTGGEEGESEHPRSEHPTSEHPNSEHPN